MSFPKFIIHLQIWTPEHCIPILTLPVLHTERCHLLVPTYCCYAPYIPKPSLCFCPHIGSGWAPGFDSGKENWNLCCPSPVAISKAAGSALGLSHSWGKAVSGPQISCNRNNFSGCSFWYMVWGMWIIFSYFKAQFSWKLSDFSYSSNCSVEIVGILM